METSFTELDNMDMMTHPGEKEDQNLAGEPDFGAVPQPKASEATRTPSTDYFSAKNNQSFDLGGNNVEVAQNFDQNQDHSGRPQNYESA